MRVAEQGCARFQSLLVDDGAAACKRPALDIGGFAGGEEIMIAEVATAAGDDKGDDHAVSHTDFRDTGAAFLDDAHELMSEDVTILHFRNLAAIDMQIRTADRRGRDPENEVVIFEQ